MFGKVSFATALLIALAAPAAQSQTPALGSVLVQTRAGAQASAFDGVVEAVRQTVVGAQVAGAIVSLEVKAGDRVRAGQVIARIDSRTAQQTAAASDAQVNAARAGLEIAARDLDRQKRLFDQRFISQAALDRAQADFRSAQAQVAAQIAQAGATHTQSGLFVVQAPYAGVIAEVPVALGDMAMPGKPLATLIDPGALRVTVAIPQTLLASPEGGTREPAAVRLELPAAGTAARWLTPARVQILPTADPATHTLQLRLDLAPGVQGLAPGQFIRVWLTPSGEAGNGRLYVPQTSVVRRAEMAAVYVIAADGRPALRQIRLGRPLDNQIEVLAGLSAGDRVATDPQAAAALK